MKPIITLIALLACLASLAQALNHDGIRRLITEDIPQSIWYSGDTITGSCIDAGLPETNQAGQIQSRNRPAATDIPHNLFLHEEGAWQESKMQHRTVIATITKIPFTNVVTGDNHRGCPFRNTSTEIAPGVLSTTLLYHPYHEGCFAYIPPTERWTVTTVGVRHTATIPGWPGELVKEDITSCTTNREVLKADWVKVEPVKIQVISGGGGGFGEATITNTISESITNIAYYEPIISDGTLTKFRPLYSNAPTNGPDPTIWQYDSNRKWNKDIEELKRNTEAESKRVMEKTGESVMYIRGDGRVLFDFKTDAKDIELGYKPDGTVTWRKTPERTKP